MITRWHHPRALFLLILWLAPAAHSIDSREAKPEKIRLQRNWRIQSSCQVQAQGPAISSVGFSTTGWHPAEVPTTVVGTLVADKTYPFPFFGTNLKSFPGMNYSSASFFANQPMPEDSPFRCSWWFRTEFAAPTDAAGKRTWLHFDAINYRANIWLNGKKVADAQDVAGTYRIFEFDVTPYLAAGRNALAVEVTAPDKNDLGMTWVDWNPTPADKDMGLWKDVYLTASGAAAIHHPFVRSSMADDRQSAELTLSAEMVNTTDHPLAGTLRATIDDARVSQTVTLNAGETKIVSFTPQAYPQLKISHPRLWWPYTMGTPEMYAANFAAEVDGHISDQTEVHFGIRQVTSQITERGHRLFLINGRKILVRGAAWAPDMLLRWSPEQASAALQYTRAMGLNTIRLEGRMERDEFFEMADRMGVLIMPGWTCCDMWERWSEWTPDTMKVAAASLTDQIKRLRNHPSVFVWLYGSDNPPPANIETMYLNILGDLGWPNPSVSSASEQMTTLTGGSGVKMTGPYDYVPPNYWLSDTTAGGAYGFNTETSPGPAIPPLESLKKFIPADHLWPIDDYWNYHAGGERFTSLDRFLTGLDHRYGKSADLNDFLRKSQAMNYEAERAMFEAYARNKYNSSGVVQWMLNNAWPSLIWHLYDYYLVPAGGYFGTKKACEPLHVQYSYDDNSISVINGYDYAVSGLKVSARIYSIDARLKLSIAASLDAPPDSSMRALQLPPVDGALPTYFLKLELRDSRNQLMSDNFYWLSIKPDVIDWAKRDDTIYTPQSDYADLTGLNQLRPVRLVARTALTRQGKEWVLRVQLTNPSADLAFMAHLRVATANDGDDVVPIFWDDNYISLLPGEKREVTARFDAAKLAGKPGMLFIDGWNVSPARKPLVLQ